MKSGEAEKAFQLLKFLQEDLRKGQVRPVYAFAGEKYFTERAAKLVIDSLVPLSDRTWNLERYDGQTVDWPRVLRTLQTPGFGASPKIVWLVDVTLSVSQEGKEDSTGRMLRDWASGRQNEAAAKLADLLARSGWDFGKLDASLQSFMAPEDQVEVFGRSLDDTESDELRKILRFAVGRKVAASAVPDPVDALMQILSKGLPPRVILLLTTGNVDQRGRLWRKAREVGLALFFAVSRERNQALSRDTAGAVIQQIVRQHGQRIGPRALELLVQRAGVDVERLASEVEKLCLWVGAGGEIQSKDVVAATADLAESWVFDFTGALSKRDLAAALRTLQDLLARGEQPLRLVALLARELRLLLLARECLERDFADARDESANKPGALASKRGQSETRNVAPSAKGSALHRGKASERLQRSLGRYLSDYNTFSKEVLPRIPKEELEAFGRAHAFVLFKRFQDALLWSVQDLHKALMDLASLDHQLKTSRLEPRVLLEGFLLRWCAVSDTQAWQRA